MIIFVGIPKAMMGVTVVAEYSNSVTGKEVLKNVAMAVEVATDRGVGLQFHPNPYFCVDAETTFDSNDYLLKRFVRDPSDKAFQDYQAMMTRVRASRSGIIPPERGFAKSLMESLKSE